MHSFFHQSFTFNSQFLYKLKHKVRLFKRVSGIFHFLFCLVFIKVYDHVHTLRIHVVPKRSLLQIRLVSILLWCMYDVIRNTNRNNSALLNPFSTNLPIIDKPSLLKMQLFYRCFSNNLLVKTNSLVST